MPSARRVRAEEVLRLLALLVHKVLALLVQDAHRRPRGARAPECVQRRYCVCLRYWCTKDLRYWYKMHGADAARPVRVEEVLRLLALLVQQYQYW